MCLIHALGILDLGATGVNSSIISYHIWLTNLGVLLQSPSLDILDLTKPREQLPVFRGVPDPAAEIWQ